MKKEQKVWIKSDPARREEIVDYLASLTSKNNKNSEISTSISDRCGFICFINHNEEVDETSIGTNYAKTIMEEYTEIKLDDVITPKYQFHPFEKIMVRDEDNEEWRIDFFDCETTLENDGEKGTFLTMTCNSPCKQCIPYNEITKCLKDTKGPYTKDMEKKVLFATTLKED